MTRGGTVSVKIKKMPGAPLSSLFTLLDSDEVQRDEYKSVLLELTRKDTNLASQLSKKLQEKQIYIHDINAYNLQFDKNAGFYLPGFDATGAVVQQKPLSDDQVDIMTAQITDLLNRFGQRAGIITDIIPPSIKIEDSLITHKKNMYLLQSGGNEVPGKNVQSSTTDAQVDEVNIEKMFDLSCLDERNDMSTTDILRSIGKTMQKPLTNAYMEGEIVVHYEVMKKGCPVSMAGTTKEKILSGIDNVVTGVLSFVPGASPLILLQGIVGPALVKLSDDLSGKEPSSEEMDEINMTLLSMMRQTVPTLSATSRAGLSLSAAEKKALSKKEKVTLAERNLITPRFTLVDNKQGITVSGKVYEFNGGDSDEPFIIVDGQAKEVAFNQNTEQWYFVTEVKGREYISYSEESKNIYGISLEDAIKDKGFFVSVSGFSNKVLTFQHSKFGNFDGVYVDDTIVPINEYKIGDINVVVASVGGEEETVVLIHQDSGWKFEPESVAMDHSTEALLKMQPVKYRYKAQNKFTAIQSDGFCYNEKKEAFIKKDNNYFKVNKSVSEIYSFSERHGDLFTRENGVFQLIYSPDIILGYKSRTIDFYTSREGTLQQNIELAAVDYLNSYAELVSPVKPYTRLGPGVYIEDSGRKIFSVGQNHFEVVDYSSEDGMVTIKRSRHVESQGDIQLYSVDGMYVRVRNENKKQVLEYIEKSFCRIARAPGSSSRCLPVVMTESLNRLLNIFILFDSSSKTILDKGIVDTKIDKFPGLFWNPETGQYYYLHEGQYFHAEILPVGHKLNCINDEVLRIFSKGVLYGKNNIAFMVFEKKTGELK